MKWKSLVVFVIVMILIPSLFVGCGEGRGGDSGKKQYVESNTGREYDLITIDGCEYIQERSNYNYLTHKGNCKNPIHEGKGQ